MSATTERQTMAEFVTAHGVKLTAQKWYENPYMDGSAKMDNWRCTLRCGRRSMLVYFSKGFGLKGERPDVAEVLDCLASDSADLETSKSFEEWAAQYGYDLSRKAERTFKMCEKQAAALRRVLGNDAFEALLWNVAHL